MAAAAFQRAMFAAASIAARCRQFGFDRCAAMVRAEASGSPGVDGLRVVDVLVAAADGPDVAARAAAGLIAIVVVAGE